MSQPSPLKRISSRDSRIEKEWQSYMVNVQEPESSNVTIGLGWIEKLPVIIGVSSGNLVRVVKLTRPCLSFITYFLPLFWLEFCLEKDLLG